MVCSPMFPAPLLLYSHSTPTPLDSTQLCTTLLNEVLSYFSMLGSIIPSTLLCCILPDSALNYSTLHPPYPSWH
eukprot:5563981-Pyramimonas_sp.AAC.1